MAVDTQMMVPADGIYRHDPPTEAYCISLAQRLRAFYATSDLELQLDRLLREQLEPIDMPEELRRVAAEFRDATATDEHARALAEVAHARPGLHVVSGFTDESQDNAELREHFTEELIFGACDRVDGLDVWTANVDACLEGGAWLKVVLDWEQWADVYHTSPSDFSDDYGYPAKKGSRSAGQKFLDRREEAKRRSYPISLVSCDTVSILPLWEGQKVTEVIERTRRPSLQTLNRHHLGFDPKHGFYNKLGAPLEPNDTRSLGATVDYYEHWDSFFVTRFIYGGGWGRILEQQEHHMGRHPYFFAPGLMSNHWRQRKLGWGVTRSMQQMIRMKSFIMSLILQEAAQQVGAPVIHIGGAQAEAIVGDTGTPRGSEEWPLNAMLNWKRDDDVKEWPIKAITPALTQLLKQYSEEIEKLLTPRLAGDIGGSSLQGAGFASSLWLNEGQLRRHPFVRSLERQLVEVTRFIWHIIVDVIQEDVYVNYAQPLKSGQKQSMWLIAGPKELRDPVPISWVISVKQASADMIEERTLAERVKNGSMSIDMMIESLGDSPSEVRRGREMDRIRQTDWYIAMVDEAVMQGMARGDLKAKAAMKLAQTGQFPGAPSVPSPVTPNLTPPLTKGSLPVGSPVSAGQPMDEGALASAPNGGGPGAVLPPLSVQNRPGATPGVMGGGGAQIGRQLAAAGAALR